MMVKTALFQALLAATTGTPVVNTWEQAVLATSPVGFWRFNEAAAPFASIGSAAVSLGMQAGSTTQQQRLYPSTGKKAALASTSSYMRLTSTDSAALRIAGDLTIVCAFSMSTLPASAATSILCAMAGTGETEAVNGLYYLGVMNDAGVYKVSILHETTGAANITQSVAFPFAVNTAYVLTLRRDTVAKTYTIDINGEFIQTASYSDNPVDGSSGQLWVGSDLGFAGSSQNTLQGAFDELAIWNRRLSDIEVQSLWAGALYGMDAQTDDFSTNTIANYTTGGNSAGTWSISGGALTAAGGLQITGLLNGLFSNRVRCKMTEAAAGGLILRYVDNNNYFLLEVEDASAATEPNTLSIWRKQSGAFTRLAGPIAISFTRGTEQAFDFIAIGSRLIAKMNDTVVATANDTNFAATGRAGLSHTGGAGQAVFTEFTWRAVDPFFDNVVFLSHMDGANGSTSIIDEVGHTVTAFGGAALTTTSPKFGSACFDINSELDRYIETSHASDFTFPASSNFVIELWRKQGIRTLQENYLEINSTRGTSPSGRIQLYHANGDDFPRFWTSGTSTVLVSSVAMPRDGQYHHEAWARTTNTLRAFVDGTAGGSNTSAGASWGQSYLRWGTFENPTPVDQTYDELRITKGTDRGYTTAFAKPAIRFPDGAHA